MGKSKRKKKKEKFVKSKKKKSSSSRNKLLIGGGIIVAVIVAIVVIAIVFSSRGKKVYYEGETIEMTEVKPEVEKGKISISENEVRKKKIVYFDYVGAQTIPLLAYLSTNNQIVAAVSMCEPCKSTKFHIENVTLVCNACGTTWTLEGLEGISGGCKEYPPDVLEKVEVKGGKVLIDEKEVQEWKPRI